MSDDLSKFLDFLYRKTEGYVYVATKTPMTAAWHQEFFNWPKQKQAIYDYIRLQGSTKDVYVGPSIFKSRSALKKNVLGSNVVWVEFDGQEQIDFADIPKPDCIVQSSSSTHLHCYWSIPFSNSGQIEEINRRLTYHLEADSSGWDSTQVLRPPDSKNWKHDGIPVQLVHFTDNPPNRDFAEFDSAPEVEHEVIRLNSDMLLDPEKLLRELSHLPAKLQKRIRTESVGKESGARSSFLMKIGYELAEEGCSHLQIVSILAYVDERVGKFEGRQDKLTRLSELAARALLQVEVEEALTLYSPLDIVNYKEELEWIIPGWLHSKGFMIVTGPPAAGKTTLAMQLAHDLAVGQPFLNMEVLPQERMLFISLEMNVVELGYIFKHHYKEWGDDQKWDQRLRTIDVEASLLDYEDLIGDYNPSVVLVDSLTELTQAELKEDESRAITRWIKKLRRRYDCSFIVIHHNRKDGSGGGKRPTRLKDLYGSYIFGKDSDTVLNLERELDDLEEGEILLHSLKTRYGRAYDSILTQNDNQVYSVKDNANQSETPAGSAGISFNFGLKTTD